MARFAEVLIQAGHEGRRPPQATGATGPLGKEIDWTPIVANEATRVLRAAGISVIREDAFFDDSVNIVNLALFIHFDGNAQPCATGASVGYKPRSVDPTLSDKPTADAWKNLYSRYFPFNWMPDNFTPNLSHYYGYQFTRSSIAEMVIELGAISCPAQAAWLQPRLKWLGRLIAHFASQRIGRGNIPDPGAFNPAQPEVASAGTEEVEDEALRGVYLDDQLSECADDVAELDGEPVVLEASRMRGLAAGEEEQPTPARAALEGVVHPAIRINRMSREEEMVSTARSQVRASLGDALASKASAELCMALAGPRQASPFLERAAGPATAPAAIVEFSHRPEVAAERHDVAESIRKSRAWGTLKRSLQKAPAGEGGLLLQMPHLLRQANLIAVRDDFFQTCGSVYHEVERKATVLPQHRRETAGTPAGTPTVTQRCWLNRSIRVQVDPRVVADIASDPNIQRFDLPRRLAADIQSSASTVGAPTYRERRGLSGRGIIVAVIDSEVHMRHPAFQDRVILKRNFTQEAWGTPDSHGTAVAGIIAANGDMVGMAPEATIYNYKVLATTPFLNGDDFDGALALQQALEDGAHIANCSWGAGPAGDGTSREARACDTAWGLGLTIVKSAGNRGPGTGTLTTPADADGVIVVGATDQAVTTMQDYSSRGPTPDGKQRPHLVAPGGTPVLGLNSCSLLGVFDDCGFGTSFAAPHVTGLIALLLEEDPDQTPDELRTQLLGISEALAGLDANTQGAGLVSLGRLL